MRVSSFKLHEQTKIFETAILYVDGVFGTLLVEFFPGKHLCWTVRLFFPKV